MCAELWNEQPPFLEVHFGTPYAFMMYVTEGNRPQIRSDCPPALAELFTRCWASERLQRPSIADVVQDLTVIVERVKISLPANVEHVKPRSVLNSISAPNTVSNPKSNTTASNHNKMHKSKNDHDE